MVFVVIALVVVVVVVAAAAFALTRRRSSATTPTSPSPPVAPTRPEPEPMTGLESALSAVTDRDGRPIREHIDAEPVDDLRVPDDTGPLLRRALDHVEHHPGTADDEGGRDTDADSPEPPGTR